MVIYEISRDIDGEFMGLNGNLWGYHAGSDEDGWFNGYHWDNDLHNLAVL